MTAYVYLIKMGSYHKIGWSENPAKRLTQLNDGPESASLVHAIQTPQPGPLEKALHWRFYAERVRGEWFLLSEADVALVCSVTACESPAHLPAALQPPPRKPRAAATQHCGVERPGAGRRPRVPGPIARVELRLSVEEVAILERAFGSVQAATLFLAAQAMNKPS